MGSRTTKGYPIPENHNPDNLPEELVFPWAAAGTLVTTADRIGVSGVREMVDTIRMMLGNPNDVVVITSAWRTSVQELTAAIDGSERRNRVLVVGNNRGTKFVNPSCDIFYDITNRPGSGDHTVDVADCRLAGRTVPSAAQLVPRGLQPHGLCHNRRRDFGRACSISGRYFQARPDRSCQNTHSNPRRLHDSCKQMRGQGHRPTEQSSRRTREYQNKCRRYSGASSDRAFGSRRQQLATTETDGKAIRRWLGRNLCGRRSRPCVSRWPSRHVLARLRFRIFLGSIISQEDAPHCRGQSSPSWWNLPVNSTPQMNSPG